jgi:uncharacterized paraquat-inducible protein A
MAYQIYNLGAKRKMPRYCIQCKTELADDEKDLCTRCQFYALKDKFEPGNIG